MAKQPVAKSGTSRIRFIMIDAELPEGDLSEITNAIQNALKPTTTIIQQRLPNSQQPVPNLINSSPNVDIGDVDVEEEFAPSHETDTKRSPKETRVRRPTSMKVLDLDLTTGLSFESFANQHAPKNDTERNLVVLAWFKDHRPDESVTANHVYTCYRLMKWPSGIEDFSGPLRQLKKNQLVTGTGKGQYVINHLGTARVDKMGSTA